MIGIEKARHAVCDRTKVMHEIAGARHIPERSRSWRAGDERPELLESRQSFGGLVAGDERSIDGSNRSSDHPVGLHACLVHRLVHTGLKRTQCAATLHDQHDLIRSLYGHGFKFSCPACGSPGVRSACSNWIGYACRFLRWFHIDLLTHA
jgi:hypothetical protein